MMCGGCDEQEIFSFAGSKPKGVAKVIAVVSSEITLPIISGATVSWICAMRGTLKKVPDAPMMKQQKTNTGKAKAGRIPLTKAVPPSAVIDREIIRKRLCMPPQKCIFPGLMKRAADV